MAAERLTILSRSRADADLVEHLADAVGALARAEVAFQEVAAAFQAAGDQDAVDALLEGLEDVLHLDLAGAGVWTMRTLAGYCMRLEPARSAAA